MEKMYKAFARLSLKDKVVFFVGFLAVAALFIGLFIKLSMKGILTDYPECTLARIGDSQKHEDFSYDDLPCSVTFPGTSEGINVGGEQLNMSPTGVSFAYSDDFIIATFVSEKGIKNAITEIYPELLSTKKVTAYESKESGSGFLNTYALTYDAGLMRCTDAPYFMVTYMKGFSGVSVITKDKDKLGDAKKLLDRIANTFKSVEAVSLTDEEGDEAHDGADEDMASSGEPSENDESVVDSLRDTTGATERMREDAFKTSSMNPTEYADLVDVDESLEGKDIYVVFEYYNIMAVPESAVLTGPDNFKAEAIYMNDEADGIVLFEVENAKKGVYRATFDSNASYGKTRLYAMEKELYDASSVSYDEVDEPYARDWEEPDR